MMERYQAAAADALGGGAGSGGGGGRMARAALRLGAPHCGRDLGGRESGSTGYNFVSGGYFRVFRIPVVRGRVFSDGESEAEAPVVVVSEAAARRFWPGREAIGQTIVIPPANRSGPYFDRAGIPRRA